MVGVPPFHSRDGDLCVIVASKGESPTHPAWYHKLLAQAVTVEAGGETFEARARVTEGAQRDRLFAERVASSPNFAEYQRRTTRVISVVVLERLR